MATTKKKSAKKTTRGRKTGRRTGANKSSRGKARKSVGREIHRAKRGRGAAKSKKQAIAIGLSKARRSGAKIPDRRRSSRSKSHGSRSRSSARRH